MIRHTFAVLRAWLTGHAQSRHRISARMRIEQLEDRVTPSAGLREQYMLELVNRMRENPAAELPLLLNSTDPNVISSLNYFNVNQTTLQTQWNSLVAAPPLAWTESLALAAG